MFAAPKQAISVFEITTKWEYITEGRISTVIAMLPASLQSRITPYRRSNSLHNLRVQSLSNEPLPRPRPLSESDALVLAEHREVTEILRDEHASRLDANQVQAPPLPPRSRPSSPKGDEKTTRTASGIHWRYARQGIFLVDHFAGNAQPAIDDESCAFERKAYIDGLTYLLRGLPADLAPYETEQIRSALPDSLTVVANHAHLEGSNTGAYTTQRRSVLHRTVQTMVINLIFFLHFILPYLMLCFKFLARLERKHRVSERLVGHGVDFAKAAGRRGALLTETVYNMNDGKVGRALSELVAWTVDGVTRGISDGVGEGLVVIGVRPSTASRGVL